MMKKLLLCLVFLLAINYVYAQADIINVIGRVKDVNNNGVGSVSVFGEAGASTGKCSVSPVFSTSGVTNSDGWFNFTFQKSSPPCDWLLIRPSLAGCTFIPFYTLYYSTSTASSETTVPIDFTIYCGNSNCVNECPGEFLKQCATSNSYRICGNIDTDLCLEWGGINYCTGEKTCSDGDCVQQTNVPQTCTDSDGGDNIYVKGTRYNPSAGLPSEINLVDYCILNPNKYDEENIIADSSKKVGSCSGDQCYLIEYHCKDDIADAHKGYKCPYGCSDGAYLASQPTNNYYSLYVGSFLSTGSKTVTLVNVGQGNSIVVEVGGVVEVVEHGNPKNVNGVQIQVLGTHFVDEKSKRYASIGISGTCPEGSTNCFNGMIQQCNSGSWTQIQDCGGTGYCDTKGLVGQCTTLTSCANEGKQFSAVYKDQYPEHCCEGLTEWNSGMDTSEVVDGECVQHPDRVKGSPVGTCIKCGDGVCGTSENVCNCPQDCKSTIINPITSTLADFPYPFVTDGSYTDTILFVGANAPASDTLAMVDVTFMLQYNSNVPFEPKTHLDSEFTDPQFYMYNIIAFGNPCDNSIIGKIAPEYACGKFKLDEGHAVIKSTNKFGRGTMIVSGATQLDTRIAAKVLANYQDYNLKGEEVCVTGTIQNPQVKEGACSHSTRPSVCGDGVCEPSEKNSCPQDCQGPKVEEKCKPGDKLDYSCVDGTKISWCSCLNNEWKCIASPETQCPSVQKCNGCYDDSKNCVPYGTRTESDFCDSDGNFYAQVKADGECNNNYECETNLCVDSQCISSNLWQKFMSWLKAIFS
jgi:hypothetical protein